MDVIINLTTNMPIDICRMVSEYVGDRDRAYLDKLKLRIKRKYLCMSCLTDMDDNHYYHCSACLSGIFCESCVKKCKRCCAVVCEECDNFHTKTGCIVCDEVYNKLTTKIKKTNCSSFLNNYVHGYLEEHNKSDYEKMIPISKYIVKNNVLKEYKNDVALDARLKNKKMELSTIYKIGKE
jgi:hypothetical protein